MRGWHVQPRIASLTRFRKLFPPESNVRGATKCVPLNVDRKLYSAILFVKLSAVNRSVSFLCSVPSRLSVPTLKSKRVRRDTRSLRVLRIRRGSSRLL